MSSKKRVVASVLWMTAVIVAGMAMLVAAISHAAHPSLPGVTLKGYDNAPITAASVGPYSPRLSCSDQGYPGLGCHSYSAITNAYHFQQGRTNAAGQLAVSDAFSAAKPWILSAGMFGKW